MMAQAERKVVHFPRPAGGRHKGHKSPKVIYRHGPDPDLKAVLEAVDESGQLDKTVSAKSGVHRGTISKWRRGITSNPQHRTMAAIAKAVGLYWRLVRANKP